MKIRDRSFDSKISLLKILKGLFGWGETKNIKNRGEKIDVFALGLRKFYFPQLEKKIEGR